MAVERGCLIKKKREEKKKFMVRVKLEAYVGPPKTLSAVASFKQMLLHMLIMRICLSNKRLDYTLCSKKVTPNFKSL